MTTKDKKAGNCGCGNPNCKGDGKCAGGCNKGKKGDKTNPTTPAPADGGKKKPGCGCGGKK